MLPDHMTNPSHRLRIRNRLRHFLPVLLNRAHGWRIRTEDALSRSKSRFLIIDIFRNWTVWLDGNIPDCYFQLEDRNEHGHLLVDDAGMFSEESLQY